jgi:ABC-2 type transport system ATP-binding protein
MSTFTKTAPPLMSALPATVTVSSISKKFGPVTAVQDVSFDVYPGEVFGLLGPNGAGKTTSIRIILDIFKADSGRVSLFGGGSLDEAGKRRIGYMPEERGLYKDLKLEPTLIFLATLKGLSESEARQRLKSWLERLDLYEHRHKKVQELSKGMQQKAQLIATLLHEPDLIIVDEPFSGLDPINTRLVKQIMEEQREAGRTIIMSTHQMYQVEALCTRIALIHHGRSVLYGKVSDIKRQFADNAINLVGEGDFANLPGVLENRQENGAMHLVLDHETSPQDIFRAVAAHPEWRVDRFEVAEPSLDDIFVAVAQGAAPIEGAPVKGAPVKGAPVKGAPAKGAANEGGDDA